MTAFASAIALAICIEGLLYAAFPEQMKQMLASLLAAPASRIRVIGLACAGIGLIILWVIRSTFPV